MRYSRVEQWLCGVENLANQPNQLRFTRNGAVTSLPVLQAWELPRLTINVAYPSRRHLPAKVRCFVDFLVEQFAKMDYERRCTA